MKRLLMFVVLLVILGCDIGNCKREKEGIRDRRGAPEEVTVFSSSNRNIETWYYYSQGISYTFTSGFGNGCDISTFTFTPIPTVEKQRCNKGVSRKERFKIVRFVP